MISRSNPWADPVVARATETPDRAAKPEEGSPGAHQKDRLGPIGPCVQLVTETVWDWPQLGLTSGWIWPIPLLGGWRLRPSGARTGGSLVAKALGLVAGGQGAGAERVVRLGVGGMAMVMAVVMAVAVTVVMAVAGVMAVAVAVAVIGAVMVLGTVAVVRTVAVIGAGAGGGAARRGQGDAVRLAGAGALQVAEGAGFAEALHMVVMAALGGAHLQLKTEHLGPVFAQGTVHLGVAPQHLIEALAEGFHHQGVVA